MTETIIEASKPINKKIKDSMDFESTGKRVIRLEANAIGDLEQYINADFHKACELLFYCKGRVVVTGMGKSGHIGGKIAATLASTGTPSFFVHPGEASHGDLGMITPNDVVLALSNSGETNEVLTILPLIKRMNAALISLTGNPTSTLANAADVSLDASVREEACTLNLAPTSSTTATLVMGDALAVALLEARGFTAEDFALSHPGGALGRKLLLHVRDIMHSDDAIPRVNSNATISDALLEMTNKGLGMTAIVDDNNILQGIFTDGDLRRALDQDIDIKNGAISEVMTKGCQTTDASALAAETVQLMESRKITSIIAVDENNSVVGALNIQDLLRAGVI